MPVRRNRSRDGVVDPIRRPPSRGADAVGPSADVQQEPLVESSTRAFVSSNNSNASSSSPPTTRNRAGGSSGFEDLESQPFLSSNNNAKALALNVMIQQIKNHIQHNPDSIYIFIALIAWYLVGVLAICTTKLLLSTSLEEGGVPSPLLMTLQQMTLGSLLMGAFCHYRGPLQPWPKQEEEKSHTYEIFSWSKPRTYVTALDFLLLAGLFNGLDFLASNTSFSKSSASFVETIKASEPITTTALAVWWGIDRLEKMETISLTILITGVLISTYANATAQNDPSTATTADVAGAEAGPPLMDSIKTCLTVMTANLCFAFRAMSQKLLRSRPSGSANRLDDFNLLFRMQQTGAFSLVLPVLLFQRDVLIQVLFGRTWKTLQWYVGISIVNAWAFATYCLASCYILTRISVVQHSGFGCLRRLFAIVATSIAFGVPIHLLGAIGILMSIIGFSGFTHYRFQKQGKNKKSNEDEGRDNVNEELHPDNNNVSRGASEATQYQSSS